jgi:antirestriction protein ArdC
MATQTEIRQDITSKIVEALKAGTPPWRQPWRGDGNTGSPTNAMTGRGYRGVNILLLELATLNRSFRSKWWGSYRQWHRCGGQVRRGEHGTRIVFWKPVVRISDQDGEENQKAFPVLRTWTVFNAEQVKGDAAERLCSSDKAPSNFVDYNAAEEVIAATGAGIRHGAGQAYYDPKDDCIHLPTKGLFCGPHGYYATALHELAHWTGHESRLARLDKNARFGDRAYAFEELVAEMAGCFLANEIRIPQSDDLSNHQAYLSNWLQVLENDSKAIFAAATQASAAADFVLAFSRNAEAERREEEASLCA